jgi:hypothetical protein
MVATVSPAASWLRVVCAAKTRPPLALLGTVSWVQVSAVFLTQPAALQYWA